MKRTLGILVVIVAAVLCSCSRKQDAAPSNTAAESPQAPQSGGGPHVVVILTSGSKVPGVIVASSQTDMVVAGDDGIERKIPLEKVKTVEYGEPAPREVAKTAPAPRAPAPPVEQAPPPQQAPAAAAPPAQPAPASPERVTPPPPPAAPPAPVVTTRTYELPVASEVSVRTNEPIDSATAREGQTFDAQVTRNAKDSDGAVVIPRGSRALIVIRSASKGGHFRGASDLVLDLQSVVIGGRPYAIDTAEVSQKGKPGLGANQRTAEYTGGGAALGAIIGAIAGGGKGAAIGAGAGAGAGVLTQVLTKGGSIKVPVETVLTFRLDKPLKVTAAE